MLSIIIDCINVLLLVPVCGSIVSALGVLRGRVSFCVHFKMGEKFVSCCSTNNNNKMFISILKLT